MVSWSASERASNENGWKNLNSYLNCLLSKRQNWWLPSFTCKFCPRSWSALQPKRLLFKSRKRMWTLERAESISEWLISHWQSAETEHRLVQHSKLYFVALLLHFHFLNMPWFIGANFLIGFKGSEFKLNAKLACQRTAVQNSCTACFSKT